MDLTVEQEQGISRICEQNGIVRLAAFGSRTSDEASVESELDLLVEFAPGQTPGFFGIASLAQELSEVFGLRVDLRTPRDLSRHFRYQVVQSAEDIYAA